MKRHRVRCDASHAVRGPQGEINNCEKVGAVIERVFRCSKHETGVEGGVVGRKGRSVTLSHCDTICRELVESCVAGANLRRVRDIAGFRVHSTACPWLLENAGDGPPHTDLADIRSKNSKVT